MTKNAPSRATIARSLPGFGVLLASLLAGCSGAAPAPEPTTHADSVNGVATDELAWSSFCGGPSNKQCSDDRVCVPILTLSCPGPKVTGLCVPRPDHCPGVSDPVCGCDGKTYTNVCTAVEAGSAIEHRGACAAPKACEDGGAKCPGAGTCVTDPHQCHHILGVLFGNHQGKNHGACECNATLSCGAGQRFNDDPSVCACESNGDPCAGMACRNGEECVVENGTATCVPDACSGVVCRNGEECVVQNGAATCVPDACSGVVCRNGEQCVVENGAATCMPDACTGMVCRNGQTCFVQADGTPACH